MDKKTIKGYLEHVKTLMKEGRFIKAYNEVGFVLDNLKDEQKRNSNDN